jgi:hypothetical protein
MRHHVLAPILSLLTLTSTVTSAPSLTIPPIDSVLSTISPTHPRLLLPAGGFAAVRAKVQGDTVCLRWYNRVKQNADGYLTAAVSIYEKPDGLRLLDVCRRVLQRVTTLAFVYQVSGDTTYARRAWTELSAAAQFPDWNPVHFLDVGEMTHAFAMGYDWMYDYLTPARRDTLRTAITNFGFRPYLAAWSSRQWWITTTNNWNFVCNGGVAMGALALDEPGNRLCDTILYRALKSIDSAGAIREFEPDGAWFEGPGYWTYSTQYLCTFAVACQTALGRNFGLSSVHGLTVTGDFPIYMTGPVSKSFNYADAGEGVPAGWWLHWMAQRYSDPLYALYEYSYASPSPLDIVWFAPGSNGSLPATTPLDRHFRAVDVASLRSKWLDRTALFVAMKSGKNGLNHGHIDLGSFVLDANNERWATDLAGDDYNLPAYFSSPTRWTYYRLRAEGHNTLVINPDSSAGQGIAASTVMTRFVTRPAAAGIIADLTPAYSASSRSVFRGIALVNNRTQCIVQDEIRNKTPSTVYWFFHTNDTITLSPDSRTALLRRSGKFLDARIIEPTGAAFTTMAPAPLPTSPAPAGQNANVGYTKLTIRMTNVDSTRIVVLFTPIASAAAQGTVVAPRVIALWDSTWPEVSAGVAPCGPATGDRDVRLVSVARDRLTIHAEHPVTVALFRGDGRCVGRFFSGSDGEASLDIHDLPMGIYRARISVAGKAAVTRQVGIVR